jgi:hypothetical protein
LNPITATEEHRYIKVKRSMAAIRLVLDERKKIQQILQKQNQSTLDNQSENTDKVN